MLATELSHADDPRLDDYRSLVDVGRRRRIEPDSGLLIAEGIPLVTRLLARRHPARSVLLTPHAWTRMQGHLPDPSPPVYVVPVDVIAHVVGFDFRRQVMAAFHRPAGRSVEEVAAPARTLAVLEGLNDHENLGAVFRAAAAFGVDGVVLDPTCADPYYRRAVRVSMGTVLEVPIAVARDWPAVLGDLTRAGFVVVAMTTRRDAVPIDEVPRSRRTAVLLGAEATGLSPGAIAAATHEVTIPMTGRVDSLNVGHAAAIAFHRLCALARVSGPPGR